jgi:hypothetical protein
MGIIQKYRDKLYLKQWGLGFLKADIKDIIRRRQTNLSFTWLSIENPDVSYADPFIFKATDGKIHLLFENVTSYDMDGTISLMVCDELFKPVLQKTVLDNLEHLSYPYVFQKNGTTYVFPENAFKGALHCYEFDVNTKSFTNPKKVLDQPVIDSTILKHNNKYWLFCTMLGEELNSALHIFYADDLLGPYQPHAGNPVKKALNGTRPAGNFIEVDGQFYRPTQNCVNYYGESITINKLNKLSETEFEEEEYMIIESNPSDEFNYGIHTINAIDDLIIVDGQKKHFQPLRQISRRLKRF